MEMLPSDKYLAHLIGVTEEEFREFQEYVRAEYEKAPAPAVVAGLETATIIAIAQAVIGVGMMVAGALLAPKPKKQQERGEPTQQVVEGKQIVRNTDFSPRYGFDGTQGVTALGATIPVVYTDTASANDGGVRVNMPLLWSQTLSLYGSQMFRGVYLLGEGEFASVDEDNFAIGSNVIENFYYNSDLATNRVARATIFASLDDGRIEDSDRVLGRTAANDPGNAHDPSTNQNDVFEVYWNGQYRKDFCASYTQNSQTVFGVYSPIGNNMQYRVNPSIRPGVRSVYTAKTADDRIHVECPCDGEQMNRRDKYRCKFVTRSGLIGGNANIDTLSEGQKITYKIFPSSDADSEFEAWTGDASFNGSSNDGFNLKNKDGTELNENTQALCDDVAQAIAGLQSTWDDSLIEGEKYKIGTALGVCEFRTPDRFISLADKLTDTNGNFESREVRADFRIIEDGKCARYTQAILENEDPNWKDNFDQGYNNGIGTRLRIVATGGQLGEVDPTASTFTGGHLLRYAEAFITSSRPVNALELSIRSSVGISVRGLCNFPSAKNYEHIDKLYCKPWENQEADKVRSIQHTSDTITAPVERYSFFRVSYQRKNNPWQSFNAFVGVKGETQQNQFNYIRIELAKGQPRELLKVKLQPLSGFEIRYFYQIENSTVPLYILNSNYLHAENGVNPDQYQHTVSSEGGDVKLVFHGEKLPLEREPFQFHLGKQSVSLPADYDYDWNTGGSGDTKTVELKGLDITEHSNYVDSWGKLAEMFAYKEVTSSAESGPEHQIVAINEIRDNRDNNDTNFIPRYDNMALIGLNIQSSTEFTQLPQFSAYVTGGRIVRKIRAAGVSDTDVGPTNLLPEILLDLLTDKRFGAGKYVVDDMVDIDSFFEAKQFCKDRSYRFDGAITEPVNLRVWAADHASMHLLQFGEIDGKFFLRPAFPFTAPPIADQFSAGNIVEGSFEYQYLNPEEREPIQVSVTYREERKNPTTDNARFPINREVLVREKGFGGTPQTEQLDMSAFCTSRQHAIDAAKFMIRTRRLTDHIIKFKTTHETVLTSLYPGNYIRVHMESTACSSTRNGIVQADGTIVSATPLDPGTYDVIGWFGDPDVPPERMELTVGADGKGSPRNLIFTIPLALTDTQTYLIERITSEQDGAFSIEASVAPTVTPNGVLQLANGFDDDANWDIKP